MFVNVRYETPNEDGITRRERNEQFDEAAPEFLIPDGGETIWDWYQDASSSVTRINDGRCLPIPPSEWSAWSKIAGVIVTLVEFDILRAMDKEFCDETNKELQAYHERLTAKNKGT